MKKLMFIWGVCVSPHCSFGQMERALGRMRKAEEAAEQARLEEERQEREAEEASRRCVCGLCMGFALSVAAVGDHTRQQS